MDNALDAMGDQLEEGSLRVVAAYVAENGNVVVEIGDNGPGIPLEIQKRVFEPFFTTKPPGVGTDWVCTFTYNIIVHKHHGSINLVSRPGATRFVVTLPVQFQKGESAPSGAA